MDELKGLIKFAKDKEFLVHLRKVKQVDGHLAILDYTLLTSSLRRWFCSDIVSSTLDLIRWVEVL